MANLDTLQNISKYINTYVSERRDIRNKFKDTNGLTNPYWLFRTEKETNLRLKQIERVLRYLINKQAELMQQVQQETIKQVMQ